MQTSTDWATWTRETDWLGPSAKIDDAKRKAKSQATDIKNGGPVWEEHGASQKTIQRV